MMEVVPLRYCFICRRILSSGNSFEGLDEGCAFEFFCQVFNLPKLEDTFGKFENSEICGQCGRKMREAMLMWTQLKFLEEQIEDIKGDIRKSITKSYKHWDSVKQENRERTSELLGRALSQCKSQGIFHLYFTSNTWLITFSIISGWGDCRVMVPRVFQKSERQVTTVRKRRTVNRKGKRTEGSKHEAPKSEPALTDPIVADGHNEEDGDIHSEYVESHTDAVVSDAGDAKSDTEEEASPIADATEPSKNKDSEKCFKCKICDSTFGKRRLFRLHCTNEHGVDARFMCKRCGCLICSIRVEGGKTWFVCQLNGCGRKFKAMRYLREHHQKKCSENPKAIERMKKKYMCDQCDKVYYLAQHLRYHVTKVHEQTFRFCCEICGNGFMYQCLLDRHIKLVHMNQKDFGCDECGQRFKRPSQLFYHKRRHKGETPFVCEQCGKAFIRAGHLNLHRKNMHSTDLLPCPLCEKLFKSKQYVRNHVNSFHKKNPGYRSKPKGGPNTKETTNIGNFEDASEHSEVEFTAEISNDVPEPSQESIIMVTMSG